MHVSEYYYKNNYNNREIDSDAGWTDEEDVKDNKMDADEEDDSDADGASESDVEYQSSESDEATVQ